MIQYCTELSLHSIAGGYFPSTDMKPFLPFDMPGGHFL